MHANPPDAAPHLPTGLDECHPRAGLPNVLARLNAGDPVTVAYLGGSITQAEGWRVGVHEWLARTWPRSAVTMIGAGIGGTGSDFGVFRCDRDVLAHAPDLVFVEFAVNDQSTNPTTIRQTMEGLVRKIKEVSHVYAHVRTRCEGPVRAHRVCGRLCAGRL